MTRIVEILALLVVGVTMGFLAAALVPFFGVTDTRLAAVLQFITPPLMLVLGYFFGSSKGSDRKTELLSQAPATPPVPATPQP